MALVKSSLKSALKVMFTTKTNPATMSQHFEDFTKIYDDYAKNAIESAGSNGLATTGKSSFQSSMSPYSSLTKPTLTDYADYIEKACISYWTSSVFKTLMPPAGMSSIISITIIPMSSSSLKSKLAKAIEDAQGDAEVLSGSMSDEIDTNTKTVKVTISGLTTSIPPVSITLSNISIS